MKRILALLLALFLLLSFSACESDNSSDTTKKPASGSPTLPSDPTSGTDSVSPPESSMTGHTGVKISGTITGASVFSEGLAFVCLNGDKETTYCINKEGYIVFELNKKIVINGEIYAKFINGYALLDGGLCDTSGSVTYPEDVGATTFYDIALEGGYILAEKVTADYSSTKKEFGVMNTNFEWVVQPSEVLYTAVEEDLRFITAMNKDSYYHNDVVYLEKSKQYLDLKTGNVSRTPSINIPSEKWKKYGNNTYRDFDNNIMLDLREYTNLVLSCIGSNFVNGIAPIKFFNESANIYYFTFVDEDGEFLFEPISPVNKLRIERFYFDGENLIITNNYYGGSEVTIQCYDTNGNLLGQMNTKDIDDLNYSMEINDGVIVLYGGYNYSYKCYYYDTSFSPLF